MRYRLPITIESAVSAGSFFWASEYSYLLTTTTSSRSRRWLFQERRLGSQFMSLSHKLLCPGTFGGPEVSLSTTASFSILLHSVTQCLSTDVIRLPDVCDRLRCGDHPLRQLALRLLTEPSSCCCRNLRCSLSVKPSVQSGHAVRNTYATHAQPPRFSCSYSAVVLIFGSCPTFMPTPSSVMNSVQNGGRRPA